MDVDIFEQIKYIKPSMMTQGNPFSNISKLLQRRSFDNNEESISNLAQDVGYIWRTIPVPVIAVLHGTV